MKEILWKKFAVGVFSNGAGPTTPVVVVHPNNRTTVCLTCICNRAVIRLRPKCIGEPVKHILSS
ncbi:unknown [Tropheryma whipplei str. Twist]|uniref:Uncharacterized protein n=1 Tax=Tropheryma whipplei (strain Twist) TaxID=203267 RepID=Q83GM9_TROWT|nr:unknown [Tropheryma whipplei str. Twist]